MAIDDHDKVLFVLLLVDYWLDHVQLFNCALLDAILVQKVLGGRVEVRSKHLLGNAVLSFSQFVIDRNVLGLSQVALEP